jgi:hypothetical protein
MKGDSSIKEKSKNQYPWQNSSRSPATIHAANRCVPFNIKATLLKYLTSI